MSFAETVELIGEAIDGLGVAVIACGTLFFLARYALRLVGAADRLGEYRLARHGMGRAILLGLEFLVAGDIIRTVAIDPTFSSLGVLAGIVLIRSFLSATLEMELEGRWPWQRRDRPPARSGGR